MPSNPLRHYVDTVNRYPAWLSRFLLTAMFRYKVKLAGTAGIEILHTDGRTVTFRQKNRRKVQNHIGGIHAAAMALLAESSSGFVVGINLPADKLPLIKSMQLNYVKRAKGNMQAVASLTDEQIEMMKSTDKGEVNVKVVVTDESGNQPLVGEMIWAWIPQK